MKFIRKFLTSNATEIPLIFVLFDENKFKRSEKCFEIRHHPSFNNDDVLEEKLRDVVDYIKERYDLSKLL